MAKFKSKPFEIEAMCYIYPLIDDVAAFAAPSPVKFGERIINGSYSLILQSKQGEVVAHPGDWIIKEPDGNGCYPCKPAVFALKYEPV
jgi:hypothetical protein